MQRSLPSRVAALGLLLPLAAAPARAFERSGSLRWRFDDIEVRNESHRKHRSSWFQGYDLNLTGALFRRAIGTFKTGGSYAQGADINQAVNADVLGQRVLTHTSSAELFSRGSALFSP